MGTSQNNATKKSKVRVDEQPRVCQTEEVKSDLGLSIKCAAIGIYVAKLYHRTANALHSMRRHTIAFGDARVCLSIFR